MLTRDEINKSRQRVNYIQHYSTRIPWKDNDFTGRVDDHPKYNVAAQVIPNIASSRNIDFEEANKTKLYAEVNPLNVQHWISENAAFMSNTTLIIKMKHPYNYDDKFKHFKETNFELNPYSFLLRPFSWTQIELVNKKHEFYNFYFDLEKSKQMCAGSGDWLSHGKSQKGVFDYFFSGIEPHKSLIFPYYKQIPFIEDNRRVIAGIGNITSRVELKEYASDGSSNEKNYIWETNVAHSIRDCGEEGFLMPYQEIAEYVKENPDFDASTVTVYEAEGFRTDFSYAAEWVSYDAAIDVLNQTKIALNNIADLRLEKANNEWVNIRLRYVNRQLKEVWNQRGIYPGLGSALSAFGVKYSFDIAKHIDTSSQDLISQLKLFFTGEKETGDENLNDSLADKEDEFIGLLKDESKTQYFELLSRLNLSIDQSNHAWTSLRNKSKAIIENPYLLFELTREEEDKRQITISQIDNAMFVNALVKNNHPLNSPSKMRSEGDKRRFRAMIIYVLCQAAEQGHTLLSYDHALARINKLPLDQRTDFSIEKIEGTLEFLEKGDLHVDTDNGYFKLKKYQEFKETIVGIVNSRLNSRLPNKQDWLNIINEQFGDLQKNNEENDKKARIEKAVALKTIETSKISILLGRAGTGKTAALGIFASVNEIKDRGVLALTPTGKARVQLENAFKKNNVKAEFLTVSQFAIRSKGFSWDTMSYSLPRRKSTSKARTVIIDESSMLTEDMFACVLKLVNPHAERIIIIGDPNQLPPIKAGRPFADLINYFESHYPDNVAKLKTEMRQGSGGDDLAFAQIFSNAETVDKDVISRIDNKQTDNRLKFVHYSNPEELEIKFLEELVEVANMTSIEDIDGFNRSLGATKNRQYTNYNTGKHIEDWQILTPTKFVGIGSYYINNQIHKKYRQKIVDDWKTYTLKGRAPQTTQNIVYGDKVISNINREREYENGALGKDYIANGETGIMVRYPTLYGKGDTNTSKYYFRFASFEGKKFVYRKGDFGNENSEYALELAYALTVHKSQGSSFGKTIVIINGKSLLISKELLYTAFSRQTDKLTIISDLLIKDLVQYANDWYSNTKQRYTDLFESPQITEIEFNNQKRFFEENLIHKTARGEMVRSKSEVIVANILDKLHIEYAYEEPLNINGKTYIPDFTLTYQGRSAYLEHLGMLNNESYRKQWEIKKANYANAGISQADKNLIITKDGLDGSLDAMEIENEILTWLNVAKGAQLPARIPSTSSNQAVLNNHRIGDDGTKATRRYKKITNEMTEEVWEAFVKHLNEHTPIQVLSTDLANRVGMNLGSALTYLNFILNLVNGDQNYRAMKMRDLEFFMAKIKTDLGRAAFQNAIRSLRETIPFWRAQPIGKFSDKVEDYLKTLNE